MRSPLSLIPKRTYNTPDLSGDRVSDAWIRDNLRNMRTGRRRDKYDLMAAKLEQRQDLARQLREKDLHQQRGTLWNLKT